MTTLPMEDLTKESCALYTPPQVEVALVLETALRNNFAEATVRIRDCPDLTKEPFNLAAPGICGSPSLVEVGGVPYLVPSARKDKLYDLWDVTAACGLPGGSLIGAGCGPWPHVGTNSEMMPNISADGGGRRNCSHVVFTDEEGQMVQKKLPNHEARSAILCNALVSEGKPEKVFEITCKHRTGDDNIVSCMRKALLARYKHQCVGMGGAFTIGHGKVRVHVMPDFSEEPLKCSGDVNRWLQFFEVSSPLVCLSTMLSFDPDMEFRLEHTHCFSDHGEGGHYHCDTTPDKIKYHGYFVIAEKVYRIDKPQL